MLLTPEQVRRVYEVVDSLELNQDWIVVPLYAAEREEVQNLPDGKILIRPPGGAEFEPWLKSLRDRILDLDLSKIPRVWQPEPARCRIEPTETPSAGARRYLHWKK
jgi:hypothetical protein